MGCFLACFGLSNKRKRRKTLYNVLAAHQHHKYGTYEVLSISGTEKSIVPFSNFRDKDERKEKTSVKSKKKKKVTFNLNVQIHEINPTAYQVLDNEEEENKLTNAEPEGRTSHSSILAEGSASLTTNYPSNYRYYNSKDFYDEEDEIEYEESDIDDYDDDDEFDDGGSDDSLENDENSKQKMLLESEDSVKNHMPLDPNDGGRDKSMNIHSVLSPVENLTQWKAMKAKVVTSKHRRKENVPSEENTSLPLNFSPCSLESNALQSKPLLTEIAVDASLSNWLVPNVSKTTIRCQ